MVIIPKIFSAIQNIKAFQSTRIGGQSSGNFSSMNLGLNSGDTELNIIENRKVLLQSQKLEIGQVATVKQVHSSKVISVNTPGNNTEADGMITNEKNLYLSVSCADCASILLADRSGKVVAALHSGWRGTHHNIAARGIQQLADRHGVYSDQLFAWVGPCIGPNAFEVGEDVFEKFSEHYFIKKESRWLFDMRRAIHDQLIAAGIPQSQIEISNHCTYQEPEFFYSWRRDKGLTGRMWSVIGIRS